MASNDNIEGAQEDIPDGHICQYSIRYPNFAGSLPFNLERSFKFFCALTFSSWWFRVALQVSPTDGSVSYTITVRRTDKSSGPLDVEVWTKAFAFPLTQRPIMYKIPGMPHGCETSRTFDAIIPKDKLKEMGDQSALVQVSFCVHGCHVDNDLAKLRRKQRAEKVARGMKALCAKM